MTPGGVPLTPKAPAKTSPPKTSSQPPAAERPSPKGAQAPNALEALRSHRGQPAVQTAPDEGAEVEQGFVGRRVEGVGRNVERVGAGVERTGRAIEATGAGVERTGRAVEVGGKAAQAGGRAAEAGGKAAQKGGKALREGSQKVVQAGAKLSATGKGAIVGIPIAIVGAAGVVAGGAAEVGGKASEVGGKGAQKAGKAAERAGKATKETGAKAKEAGAQVKDAGERTKQSGQELQAAGKALGKVRDMAEERAIKGAIAASGVGAAHTALSDGLKPAAVVAEKAAKKIDLNQKVIDRVAEESGFLGRQLQKRYDRSLKRANAVLPGAGAAIRSTPALALGVAAAFSLPVLLVLVLIFTLLGGGSPVGTAANPEPAGAGESLATAQPDTMSAYRSISTRNSVPWPITAAVGYITSRHQTIHPYTLEEMTGEWPRARSGPAPEGADSVVPGAPDAGPGATPSATPTEVSQASTVGSGADVSTEYRAAGTGAPTEVPDPAATGTPEPAETEDLDVDQAGSAAGAAAGAAGEATTGSGFDEDGYAVIEPMNFISGGYGPFLLSEEFIQGELNWTNLGTFDGDVQNGHEAATALVNEMSAYVDLFRAGEVSGPLDILAGFEGFDPTPDGDAGTATDLPTVGPTATPTPTPVATEDGTSDEGYTVAGGNSEPVGSGVTVRYTIEVESGTDDIDGFLSFAEPVLSDPKSWASSGARMQRVANPGDAHVRVLLATGATARSLCGGQSVCYTGSSSGFDGGIAVIGFDLWENEPEHWTSSSDFRTYLVNHTFGHGIGRQHEDCTNGVPGVMTDQTTTLPDGCEGTTHWPNPSATGLGGSSGFANIDIEPDDITELIRHGNMDRRWLTSDEDWNIHLAMWRQAAEAVEPLIELTDVQVCVLPQTGLTTAQKIDLAVRCNSVGRDVQIAIPVALEGSDVDHELLDREDTIRRLGAEAVEAAWLYNEWGEAVACEEDAVIGGIFPVPVSPVFDANPDPEIYDPVPYYNRCDLDTNLEIAMVGHHSLPPGIGLIDLHTGPADTGFGDQPFEWMLRGWGGSAGTNGTARDGIFDIAAGNDRFPDHGPAILGGWIAPSTACQATLRTFVNGLMSGNYELPSEWSTLSTGSAANVAELWRLLAELDAWEPVDSACDPPYPDGTDPDIDRLFALEFNEAFRAVVPDLNVFNPEANVGAAPEDHIEIAPLAIRRLYTHVAVDAVTSEDGVSVITSAEWGRTSVIRRLANPAILFDMPAWTPAAAPQFADLVMGYALSMIGESCGGTGILGSGPSVGGNVDTSTSGAQMSWEDIAQVAYDVGFRGEDLVIAVALTQPESGRVPDINNAGVNTNGTIDYGLWQINTIHNPPIPQIYDPVTNGQFAYRIYAAGGSGGGPFNFRPWSAYNADRHLPYMDVARQAAEAQLGDRLNDPPPDGAAGGGLPGGSVQGSTGFAATCVSLGGSTGFVDIGSLIAEGPWAGSQAVCQSLTSGFADLPLTLISAKRDRKHTKGGGVSDHWTGNPVGYAEDWGNGPQPTPEMDAAAVLVMSRLGVTYDGHSELVRSVIVTTGNNRRYRVQVIYRSWVGGNHFNHIHVGCELR